MNVTTYPVPAKHRPQGQRCAWSWADVAAHVASPIEAQDKEGLLGWSLATFAGDYRTKDNVEEVHALGFDADEAPGCTLDELRAMLAPFAAVVHSTYSHTPDAPRWRILVQTSRPMTGDEYGRAWSRFRTTALASVGVGPQAKDPSRFWYQPGRAPGAPYEYATTDGRPVDVDELLAAERADGEGSPGGAQRTRARPDVIARARSWMQRAEPAVSGEHGSPLAFGKVERVVRGFNLSDAEALDALSDWNARCDPPWSTSPDAHAEDSLVRLVHRARDLGDTPVGSLRDEPPKSSQPAPTTRPRRRVTLSDAFRMRREQGPLEREPTGIAALDQWTAGGIPYGSTIAIVGLPDASKTLVQVQLAHTWARRGVACGIYTVDEEIGDCLVRLVQRTPIDGQAGSAHFARVDYERGCDELIAHMRDAIGDLPIVFYDADWTVESAAADLDAYARSRGSRAALFVDSVQTVTCEAVKRADEVSERRLVTENTAAVRRAGVQYRMITSYTSESNREHSKAKGRGEKGIAMSSGAESRAVEFRARALFVLSPADDDLIEVALPKNKLGRRSGNEPAFYLRLDRERQELTDAPAPAERAPETTRKAQQKKAQEQSKEAERQATAERKERERSAKEAADEAAQRRQDEEDDAAACRLRSDHRGESERTIIALLRKVRACGGTRAHDAVVRTRTSRVDGT